MSGGVRNLRAMFENKEESSIPPPDRGRSPAGSMGGGSSGTSPQPLSKVRTSFVAVERSGQLGIQWGLRKESTTDPSLATRRASFSIDAETDPKAVADKKQTINSELSARKISTAVTETVPESAIETPPIISEKRSGYLNGSSVKGKVTPAESVPSANSDKKTPVEVRNTKLLPGDTTSSAVVSGGAASTNSGGFGENLNGNTSGKLRRGSPTKGTIKTSPASRTSKPGPISIAPSSAAAKSAPKAVKSPSNPETPTTAAKPPTTPGKSSKTNASKPIALSNTKDQPKSAEMKATKPTVTSATTSKPAANPTTSTTAASTSENKPLHSSPSTGFHKPKPKSPTRPAKLPASMTAPTASSLSKVSTAAMPGRQSLAPVNKTLSRSRSHASLSQKQEPHHKPPKFDADRPALGRPSTSTLRKQPSRQSLPKHSAPADESFLARMMRPTTSSASKTTEKIVTPPRAKVTTRPTTREGVAGHKQHHGLKGSPSTKSLPAAAKDVSNEGLARSHPGEVEDMATLTKDNTQLEPASNDQEEAPIFNNRADVPVIAASDENRPVEEIPMEGDVTFTPALSFETENTIGTNQAVEKLVNREEPELTAHVSEPVDPESCAEKSVIPEELGHAESEFLNVAVETKEPLVTVEPEHKALPAEEIGKIEHHEIKNGGPEEPKQEAEPEDSVTIA